MALGVWGTVGGFIGSIFNRDRATPLQKIALANMAGGAMRHLYEGDWDTTEKIQSSYAAALRARASERSVLKFKVLEFGKETARSIQLQSMLDRPNEVQSRIDFIELLSQHYDANGNAYIYLVNDEQGCPCEQWIMPSGFVAPRFNSPSDPLPIAWTWQDSRASIEPASLVIIRNNSIKNGPYKGRGILQDDKLNLGLLDATLKSQVNNIRTGGAPNIALEFPPGVAVSPESALEYQQAWAKKYDPQTGITNIAILPDGGKAVNFGTHEINYQTTRDQIAGYARESLQVPRILLGDTDNVNHNNGQTAIAIFERVVVLRFGQKLAAAYEDKFQRNFHPGFTVTIDSSVLKDFTQLSQTNGLTTNANTESTFADGN